MNWDPTNMTSAERRELAAIMLQHALVTNNIPLIEILVENIAIIDRVIKNPDDAFTKKIVERNLNT